MSCVRTTFGKADASAQPGRTASLWYMSSTFFAPKKDMPKPFLDNSEKTLRTGSIAS